MTNSVIAQALARQIERPDIHHKVEKLTNIQSGYPTSVAVMICDLKERVPSLSIRQLSTLVGVSVKTIQNALSNPESETLSRDPAWGDIFVEQDTKWNTDDNEASASSELSALKFHHPGGYIDQTDFSTGDRDEMISVPVLFTAPAPIDPHRRADQSHTVKRPISLATTPFNVAA